MDTHGLDRFLSGTPSAMARGYELVEQLDAQTGGVRVAVLDASNLAATLGSAVVLDADQSSQLGRTAGSAVAHASVAHQIQVTSGAEAALAYALARRARIADRGFLILETAPEPLAKLLHAQPTPDGLLWQRVDMCAHYAAERMRLDGAPVEPGLRGLEVRESAQRWLATGPEWGLFRAVHEGTLTRSQYVYALSNIYQFVRHTTRLAARGVAHSSTTAMRSHFINHLNGEVNHELMIERDLDHLGQDVEFVRGHMAPNGPTYEFMSVQESLIGYYQDPVLLAASPVAAEGVTAHLDEAFIAGLKGCVESWGVSKPEKACRFLTSHMHTDGGDDGHWEMTIQFVGKQLVDESKHLFFMRALRNAMAGTRRLYDSFVLEIPRWDVGATERTTQRNAAAAHA